MLWVDFNLKVNNLLLEFMIINYFKINFKIPIYILKNQHNLISITT